MKSSSRTVPMVALVCWVIAWINAGLLDRCRAEDRSLRPGLERLLRQLGYESIELEHAEGNSLAVRAAFGGKRRILLVDTGCTVTTLETEAARGIPTLKTMGAKLEDAVLGQVNDPSLVVLDRMTLGRVEFLNQPAAVRGLVGSSGTPFGCDGLLGIDFLMRHHALLDVLDNRLYVRSGPAPTNAVAVLEESLRRSRMVEVPLRTSRSLVMTCEAAINQRPIWFLVDTGAVWSMLDNDVVTTLSLPLADPNNPMAVDGVMKHAGSRIRVTRLKTFELGSVRWTNLEFKVSEMAALGIGDRALPLGDCGGLLGGDLLLRAGALIDSERRKLWLKPVGAGNRTGH